MIWDVIIVGAGPAGTSCAGNIKGLSVLLIDGQTKADSKPCGGLLAPDARKYFARSDFVLPRDVLVDPQIFSVKTIDLATKKVAWYERSYLNMDRYAFDRMLIEKVPDNVKIISGRCERIERNGDVISVYVGKERYDCRNLVGADGAASVVRRSFYPDRKIMQYVAIQEWYENHGVVSPFYSCIFDPDTSESCSWIICKNDMLIYGGCFAKNGCRDAFARQKAGLSEFLGLDLSSPVKKEACLTDRPRRSRDFVTGEDHVFLVGEAAGFISPSSFEGISSALVSGKMLADALSSGKDTAGIYRRSTRKLRFKLLLKTKKRWFMYTPWVRKIIMSSGILSIKQK